MQLETTCFSARLTGEEKEKFLALKAAFNLSTSDLIRWLIARCPLPSAPVKTKVRRREVIVADDEK